MVTKGKQKKRGSRNHKQAERCCREENGAQYAGHSRVTIIQTLQPKNKTHKPAPAAPGSPFPCDACTQQVLFS